MDNVAQGRYILRLSSVGYQTWHSPAFELTNTQRVGLSEPK